MTRERYIRMTETTRRAVSRLPGGTKALRAPTLLCAAIYCASLLYLMFTGDRRIIRAVIVPAVCFAVVTVLRPLIGKQRPYDRYGVPPVGAYKPGKGKSMPSRHTASAAAIACVDEAISTFPQGYDTVVGERGVTLSGGQKQRVAIARMLMQQAPIMVFDDSLSAVDAETDAKIRTALRDTLHSATVLLISHRVTTLMQADRILVLDGGRVSALGTHRELIQQPGIYRDIYDIQMRSDDRALVEEGGNA